MLQFHYDITASAWIITLDGHEIARFMTEAEAKAYCDYEAQQAKSQTP